MLYTEWNENIVTGIKEMDAQHRSLFGIFEDLKFELTKEDSNDERMFHIFSGVIEYSKTHFQSEEKILKEIKYAFLPQHIEMHNNFTKEVSDLHKRFITKKAIISIPVLDFLNNWLTEHILVEDQKYASAYKEFYNL